MNRSRLGAIVVGAALALSACSYANETLWPSLTGEEPSGSAKSQAKPETRPQVAQRAPAAQPAPAAVERAPQPAPVAAAGATGTAVGKKAAELRDELNRLQGALSQHNGQLQELRAKMVRDSQGYHGTVAAINARLQVGTTPGNPILVQQFNTAQSDIDRLEGSIGEMNRLATAVTSDATLSQYLSESTRAAFALLGAVDEDHRQLAILQDEVDRTAVLVDRLLKEVTDDVRRQTTYVGSERSNLNVLSAGVKTGEIYGASLVNRAVAAAAPVMSDGAVSTARDIAGRRPLVVIRFDRPDVDYQQALYNAVSRVLERRPNATFDLVAIAPSAGGQAVVAMNSTRARRSAETVLRSLVEMGLPPGRVTVAANTSDAATSNEVHLYLR